MLVPGLPSFGDIATAIKILNNIIEAFSGAKKQYAISCGFLRQLVPVLRRMQAQLVAAQGQDLQDDIIAQHEAIGAAYDAFDQYLSKKYDGLSSKDPNKARETLLRVQWSLDELNDRVQKLKDRMSVALQPYQALMLQELNSRIDDIAGEYKSGATTTREENDKRLKEVENIQREMQQIGQALHQERLDYKQAAVEQREAEAENTAAIRSDIAEMRSDIKTDIKSNQEAQTTKMDEHAVEAQTQLRRSEDKLLALIREQQDRADSREEALRWEKMQELSEKATEKQAAEQQEAQRQVQESMTNAADAMGGLADATGDPRMKEMATRSTGVMTLIKPFVGFFGSKSDKNTKGSNSTAARPPSQAGQVRSEAQPRVYKPAPPMPTIPPPPSIGRRVSAPPSDMVGRGCSSDATRRALSPPQSMAPCSTSTTAVPRNSSCRCEMRRDSAISGTRSTTDMTRPALPPRPPTDASAMSKGAPPPLPPRSQSANSCAGIMAEVSRNSQSSTTISTISVAKSGRYASAQPSSVTKYAPQLSSSPATIVSTSSPSTSAGSETAFSAGPSPGAARVERWIASTAAASIELNALPPATQRDSIESDSSRMSVSQRRNMFESSPIMGMAAPVPARS
ncbi:hypothetical protein LTR85_008414 [Meristemomyces frigidus]|nr:hypothetical protein LTR85_008414 [Meristemomyces frigidus]